MNADEHKFPSTHRFALVGMTGLFRFRGRHLNRTAND
jgi:hypothetical protein